MVSPAPMPPAVLRRWQLARSGFTYDVTNGCWRNGPVALHDEAIDGPDADLWALLMGPRETSAPEGEALEAGVIGHEYAVHPPPRAAE